MSEAVLLMMAMIGIGCCECAGDILHKLGGLEQFSQAGGDNGWTYVSVYISVGWSEVRS